MNVANAPVARETAPPLHAPSIWGEPTEQSSWVQDLVHQTLGIVRRQFWLGLAILAALVTIAIIITMFQTPKYTAYSVIQVNDQSDRVLGSQLDSDSATNVGWDVDRFLNTQLAVLKSRSLAERVARSLNLFNDKKFFIAMQASPPEQGESERTRHEAVLDLLANKLSVDQPNTSRIFSIGFTSADPEYAAKIANAFAEQYIQSNLKTRYDSSAYARSFVAQQLEEARARLETSERDLNSYARSAGLIRARDPSDTTSGNSTVAANSVTEASLLQVNRAANDAKAARDAAQAKWNAERAQPLLSSEAVLANPTVQALMTKRAQLETDLATANERYLPTHPTVTSLKDQIAAITGQLSVTANGVRNSIRGDYEAAVQAENRLSAQLKALQNETLAEQDRSVRYNTLAREADTNRQIYDGLLQRYRELNASAGIAASNVDIVDQATPPVYPSSPKLLLNLALGLLAGLLVGGGAMLLRDQLDDAIRQPEDVESKLGLSLLGVIPMAESDDIQAELSDPKSILAEAYNSLRGSLLYSTREGLPKVMAMTSAQATEGKSTSSLAIAAGLARTGLRTVIIDADLRRPSMHKRLGRPNEHGLADLLTSASDPAAVTLASGTVNLDVILAGPIPPSASELLSSPRMAAVLETLASRYDSVIVDCPPVLGLADAPALAALTDGLVFVIEAGRVHSGALRTALRRLRFVGANMVGVVLTKFDPQRAGNRYSAYYGYDYYRYQSSDSAA